MPLYPKTPLEEKLAWMRKRQQEKADAARQKEGKVVEERRKEQTAVWEQRERLRETLALPPSPPSKRRVEENLPPEWRMLRAETVARLLSVSVRTVQRWFRTRAVIVREGPTQTKTVMLIPEKALDDWFREHAPKKVS